MAEINVYVPDELKERLDEADLPRGELSRLARNAWEQELEWIKEVAEMEELRIDVTERGGTEVELRFTGEDLGGGVYRTEEGKAILVFEESWFEWTPEAIDANEDGFADDVFATLRESAEEDSLASVLLAFGLKPVIKL